MTTTDTKPAPIITAMKHLPSTALPNLADYGRSVWFIESAREITIDDLLRPAFWAHHANRLRKHDEIDVVAIDGSFDIKLRVTDIGVNAVKVRILRKWEDTEAKAAGEREAKAQAAAQTSPTIPGEKKFPCVDFKKATGWRALGYAGETIKQGFATQADAQAVLDEYVKKFGDSAKAA